MKSFIFLTSILLANSLSATIGGGDDGRGLYDLGWQPIKNVNDPHVQEIAKFAVDEQNKNSHTPLILYKVDSSEIKASSTTFYRLIILVASGNDLHVLAEYEATVLEKSRENFQLISFKWIKP